MNRELRIANGVESHRTSFPTWSRSTDPIRSIYRSVRTILSSRCGPSTYAAVVLFWQAAQAEKRDHVTVLQAQRVAYVLFSGPE